MLSRKAALAAVLLAAVVAGCNSSGKKAPTQKEAAIQQWNNARASVLLSLANDQYKTGNFDKSRQTVIEALRVTPDNPNLWLLSAKLNIEQGQLEAAERDLKKTLELAPSSAEPHYLLGVIYQRWQKLDMALNEYQIAGDKAPTELAYVLARAEVLVTLDRSREALALLNERMTYFDNSPVIRDAAGQLMMQQGKYEDAAETFRQATMLATDDQGLKERHAKALFFAQRYRESAELLSRLTRDERNATRADLFAMLGESQLHLDRTHDARASFETATQLNPSLVGGWQGIGKVALAGNDLRRAELAIRKAVALDPGDAQNHLLMGYLRLKQDRPGDAMVSFRKASALDANDPVSLCMTGYVLEKSGQTQQAIEFYARALQIRPGDELATQLMAGVGANE